ncbi:acyltransferase family protein [Lysinibacillus parviboronicapiens]|uniref:acyltransferase family protein n=1 Tax=Lysinibacillus parviboronicapiens TaxID=436516 RepID=UPI000D3A9A55|nr:acyltransferase family protein [Lysinibacillus parviboronicapiens]
MKPVVKEIFLLRFIACLGIVLMHGVTLALDMYDIVENPLLVVLTSIQLALMFGTPLFIFISEFVIAYSYPNQLPKKFYVKRFKYIFIPFLFIGVLDAALHSIGTNSGEFEKKVILNLFEGNFHGYFIIIIFQFYFLHPLFVKYIAPKYPAYQVIITAFIINFGYLAFFNFLDPYEYFYYLPYVELEWSVLNKMPFPAWIAYFVTAYYCGRNYEIFLSLLHRFRYQLFVVFLFTLSGLLAIQVLGLITEIHSKRIDVVLYTLSVAFLLFFIASKIQRMPSFIIFISRYSFGIYLLHPLFNIMVKNFLVNYEEKLSIFFVVFLSFFVSTICAIYVTSILNKWKFGAYLVGQVHLHEKQSANNVTHSVIGHDTTVE